MGQTARHKQLKSAALPICSKCQDGTGERWHLLWLLAAGRGSSSRTCHYIGLHSQTYPSQEAINSHWPSPHS